MYWVPAIRLDLPADADAPATRRLAAAAAALLAALDASPVARLNVAVSGAALEALKAHGGDALLATLARLAAAGAVEFVGTAAHGALLPLLPAAEIARQLALNDVQNARVFGDLYRPLALWPPELAVSPRVLEAAARAGFEAVLVDEAVLPDGPDGGPGERIDAVKGLPGLFLLPRSRRLSEALAEGRARSREELVGPADPLATGRPGFCLLALEVTARPAPPPALLGLFARDTTLRMQDLLKQFPKDRSVQPLAGSQRSTLAELARGQPFAPWFSAGAPRQEARWQLARQLARTLAGFEAHGLGALPQVRQARRALDLAWRAELWRAGNDTDLQALAARLAGLEARGASPPAPAGF